MRRTKHGWTWFVVAGLGLLVGCEKPAAPEGTAGGAGGADVKQSTDSAAPVDSQVGDSYDADISPLTDGGPSVAPGDGGGDAVLADLAGTDGFDALKTDSADDEAFDGATGTDLGEAADTTGGDTGEPGDAGGAVADSGLADSGALEDAGTSDAETLGDGATQSDGEFLADGSDALSDGGFADIGPADGAAGDSDSLVAADSAGGGTDGAAVDAAQPADTPVSPDAGSADVPPWCAPEHIIPAGTHPLSDFELPPLPPVPGFQGGFYECDEPPAQIDPAKVPGPCLVVGWSQVQIYYSPWNLCPGLPKTTIAASGMIRYGYDCSLRQIREEEKGFNPSVTGLGVTTKAWTPSGLPSHQLEVTGTGLISKEIFWTYDELERLGEQLELYYNSYKCCTVPIGAVEKALLQVHSYEGMSPYAWKVSGYNKYYPVVLEEPWGVPGTMLNEYDELGRIVDESFFYASGKQVEHIHWSYIEVPKGLLVREEHDREGWVESSWENPEWSVTYPLDGKTDFGYERTYDHEGNLIARRSFTGGAVYQVSATIDGKPTTVEVFGNSDGGDNWESRYDNFGRLTEEWSWPDDWSRIFENDDPIYRVLVWRYDDYGRPLMRIDTGYSWNDKSIIWGVLSYHYDCWESFAPPASGAPP